MIKYINVLDPTIIWYFRELGIIQIHFYLNNYLNIILFELIFYNYSNR